MKTTGTGNTNHNFEVIKISLKHLNKFKKLIYTLRKN